MDEIARLGIAIDSTQVKKASVSLDELADAGQHAEKSTNSLSKASSILSGVMITLAKTVAAYKIYDLIKDSTLLAARFETMGTVMRVAGNNAGYTMAEMEKFSLSLQKSGISMIESRNVLTQLATANIDLAQASKLGRAAQDLAVVGQTNSSEALSRMVHGIKSGEIEILRTLGLNVSFEASYKKLAAELGTTSEKLTENQKTQARTNAVLEESTKYAGIYEESMGTAGKAITSLTRYWENLQLKAGEAFLPTLTLGVFTLTDALKAANTELDEAGQGGLIDAVANALLGGFKTALQTVAILIANVTYVITMMIGEMKTMATQIVALGHLDFKAFSGIGSEWEAESQAARKALDAFETKLMSVGTVATTVATKTEAERIAAGKAAKDAADAEAARLKKLRDAEAAGKQAAQAYQQQVKSAQDYIKSLKDQIEQVGLADDQLKMLDAARKAAIAPTVALRAEIMKQALALSLATRADKEATEAMKERSEQMELGIQAILRNKQAYDDARDAAKAYIETISKQAARTVAGVGKGEQVRQDQSGLNAIEDNLTSSKSKLLGDKQTYEWDDATYARQLELAEETYRAEVEIYVKSRQDLLAAQGDWANGATESIANYLSSIENVAGATEQAFGQAFKGMEDALLNFVTTGKMDFKSLADSIISDILRIAIQQSIMKPLLKAFGLSFMADGGAYDAGVQKFASGGTFTNTVVSEPTLFKFASGTGMMGEAGPEAIMPLTRGADGQLGVKAEGGGSRTQQTINIKIDQTVGDLVTMDMLRKNNSSLVAQISSRVARANTYGVNV